jgi:biopolymer transport protein TolR
MKVRCSTTSISALLFSLCLVTSIPEALSNASTWRELTLKLPYGAIWNFLAPLGFADLGIVAIGLIVLWTRYRKRERWAWFVMLIILLCFSFPSSVLPMLLQIRAGNYRWSYLLGFLGVFREGGWHCLTILPSLSKSVGIGCVAVLTTIEPLKSLVMSIALLLPIKAFFWKPVPPQLGARTKIAALWKKHTWVWVLALLLVIALAVAFMVRILIASIRNSAAQNRQQIAETFRSYNMVSVFLAKAEHPVAMPDAGRDDSIVVAVLRDGAVFLGQDKVDPAQLGSRIRDNRTDRTGETMYLRADARAQYRDVENAIEAMRSAGAEEVGLLTKRKEDAQPENYLWIGNPLLKSVGLEVSFPSPPKTLARGSSPPDRTIVVHVIYRPNAAPAYKINAAGVAHADLQSRLNEIFANRAERVMFIKGDDNLNFSDIAEVIDIGRASNVDHIGLMTPGVIAGN